MVDDQDLNKVYGHKPKHEDSYITNFFTEVYLQLTAIMGRGEGGRVGVGVI